MIGKTRVISVLCCGLSAAALSWSSTAAAQTLTLNVPFRGAGLSQSAATTIEFEASSIAGGATIDVNGTVVNVPASACGVACTVNDATPQGDDISLTRIAGTNRVRLQTTFLSVFGANYCVSTMAGPGDAIARSITLSGFTFGGGNGYRITSFMAPSDLSCDIPYARVPTNRPFITGGGLTRLGRLPLNVVLALDASPSMAWTIPGSPDIRWDRLKSSVQLFASVWDAVGAPPPPALVSSEATRTTAWAWCSSVVRPWSRRWTGRTSSSRAARMSRRGARR